MGWENAIELASHITHPVTVCALALVLAAYLYTMTVRKGWRRIGWFLVAVILLLGLAPLLSSAYVQLRGLYIVRVFVLGLDGQPVDDARVTSSGGGEAKKIQGGWEFDIPPQSRPADGKVKLFASTKSAFLAGSSVLVLDRNYYPSVEIQLSHDTTSTVRGDVVDERRGFVAGANVWVPGYSDRAVTDETGNFSLPAHAADGQMVRLRAQKGSLTADENVPAGDEPVELVLRRP